MPLYEHSATQERVWMIRDNNRLNAVNDELQRLEDSPNWKRISDTYPPTEPASELVPEPPKQEKTVAIETKEEELKPDKQEDASKPKK